MKIIFKFIILLSFFYSTFFLAVPEVVHLDEYKQPKLISAILKEDVELYSKEMKKLLNGSMEDFIRVLKFETDKGNTIFHLMAGVRAHQDFFIKEAAYIVNALSLRKIFDVGDLSLGGVQFKVPKLEDTKVGRSIMNKNTSNIVRLANDLDRMSPMEVLPLLQAKDKKGQSIVSFTFDHLDIHDRYYILNENKVDDKFEKYSKTVFPLLLKKNKQGERIAKIVKKTKNYLGQVFVVDYKKYHTSNNTLNAYLPGAIIGGIGGLIQVSSFLPSDYGIDTVLILGVTSAIGTLIGGGVSTQCYTIFQNIKIKKLLNNRRKVFGEVAM